MSICFFTTMLIADQKHLRSNFFGHTSFAIMQGVKDANGHISDLKLLSSYGYYSHAIPEEGTRSSFDDFFKAFVNANFRTKEWFALFKLENVTDLDMGFGLQAGPIIEITLEEKQVIEDSIQFTLKNEQEFFAQADIKAQQKVDSLQFTDDKLKQQKFLDKQNQYREEQYEIELRHIDQFIKENNLTPDVFIEQVAFDSGLISERRLLQEKLKLVKGIEMFEFRFDPQGQTCKNMGIEFVLQNLADDESGKVRKALLSSPLESFYSAAVPRFTDGVSKIIFHSEEKDYLSSTDGLAKPLRTWDSCLSCNLIGYDKNIYYDLQGTKQELKKIENNKIYLTVLENLLHLHRLLNGFCSKFNEYQAYLHSIDTAINEIYSLANDSKKIICIYHSALQQLNQKDCFENIARNVFKINGPLTKLEKQIREHHIKLEIGVRTELNRLIKMQNHAKKISLTSDDFSSSRNIFRFFATYFSSEKFRQEEQLGFRNLPNVLNQ